jgi:iron complex outermembrane recepter protein
LGSDPNNIRNEYFDTVPYTARTFYGFSANVDWNLGDGYKIVSLSAFRHSVANFTQDYDFSSLQLSSPATIGEIAAQLSEELRLQKDFDKGHWMAGAFFFREQYQTAYRLPFNAELFGGPDFLAYGFRFGGREETRALAAFGQGSYDFTDNWSVTVGARYSSDRKTKTDEYSILNLSTPWEPSSPGIMCELPCGVPPGTPMVNAVRTWDNFSPLGTLQYKFDSTKMAYATVSRAFKSGGYDLGLGDTYNPEQITDYEMGFKSDFLDSRLRINTSVFLYNYTNLQVNKVLNTQASAQIINAAGAKLEGIEMELIAAPTDHLRLNLAASGMHTYFTNFMTVNPYEEQLGVQSLAGNRLPNAPKYTASYGAEYALMTAKGTITPRIEGSTLGQQFLDQYNVSTVSVGGYSLWDAFINYSSPTSQYYGSLYIKNIGNLTRQTGAIVSNGFYGFPLESSFIPPRTFGIRFGIRIQ